jgi:hypothetical protein
MNRDEKVFDPLTSCSRLRTLWARNWSRVIRVASIQNYLCSEGPRLRMQHIAFLFNTEPERACNLHVTFGNFDRPVLNDTASYRRLRDLQQVGRRRLISAPEGNNETEQTNTPDPQLRHQLDAKYKKYDEAFNNNDAAAVAAFFTEDAVLVNDTGPVYRRKAIEKSYADLFQKWRVSNHTGKPDQYSSHIIGTDGRLEHA